MLKSLHDDLDAAVRDAYGWTDNPTDAQILERLVALNAERAAEEARGHIRWQRPEFQNPRGATQAWPATLPEQMAALANALTTQPQSETELATRFNGKGKWKARLPELLATLATLGLLLLYVSS